MKAEDRERYKQCPSVQKAGKLCLAGYSIDEVGGQLGISPMTAKTYVNCAGVGIDESKYHKTTRSGRMIISEAGKEWAREWDAARLPLLALMRYMR